MLLDQLNINSLRIFERVYSKKNMTLAAKELGLTQSGVSQHIKNLEESLNIKLFDRVKHRPIPTREADILAKNCHRHLRAIERGLQEITGISETIRGDVFIGIPLEFGNNFVLPLITQIGRKHPAVRFHIKYGHASEMNSLLLSGELDFAFLDSFSVDSQIATVPIWDETLALCCGQEYVQQIFGEKKIIHEKETYDQLDFVDYVEGAPVLSMWFNHHLQSSFIPNVRASLMDVQGISRIIREGLGAGILPLHVVNRINQAGTSLFVFQGSGDPLHNTISLASLEGRTLSSSAKFTKNYLMENLPKNLANI